MSCMLWEKGFYEDGEDVAARIANIVPSVDPAAVADIAIEARNKQYLRHVPLWVAKTMAGLSSHKKFVASVLAEIIQRPDELTEFLSLYWKDGKKPLSAQIKKGLATAFTKFDKYSMAKYNKDSAVKLRDVLFLCHAKPKDKAQEYLWKQLINGELQTPDTWETNLSAGSDKKETWERLMSEKKLGGMALLKNLRGMNQVNVDPVLIDQYIESQAFKKVLPFRFISAAKHAPRHEESLGKAMVKSLSGFDKLPGHTVLLVDVSGSMDNPISSKSELSRIDAACGVAMLLRESCERVDIFSFSMALRQIPPRHTFSLRDAILTSQQHSGTPLGLAVASVYADKNLHATMAKSQSFGWDRHQPVDYQCQGLRPDRLIVITDEQSNDPVPDPIGMGYMINVASNKNGVGYGPWIHIDGWSEAVCGYIYELERNDLN